MTQRLDFIRQYCSRRRTMTELCAEFRISAKTGYKWIKRFTAEGELGLADRPHAPWSIPHRMSDEVASELLQLRRTHPTWGARKLRAVSIARDPDTRWPAASSIGELLRSAGLVRHRRRRGRAPGDTHWGRTLAEGPNDVWTADFKGQFRLASGVYCYPLTVVDFHSRYLLECRALAGTETSPTVAVFRELFKRYGMPRVLRTDNGVPFATRGIAGLSALTVWCIRLGIRTERIEPGKPQQNGRHERMHRTLKAETTRPSATSMRGQQGRFDVFRHCYNVERPHEALDQQPPATRYAPSTRPYPQRIPALVYGPGVIVRRVSVTGQFAWYRRLVWVSSLLAGQEVGIEEETPGHWIVSFGSLILGDFDPQKRLLKEAPRWKPLTNHPVQASPINPV